MSYEHRRYLLMTHDPTHIGAGGYRIGRVDNSIVREPGTNLPKIPGTSLSGAIRSYAAYRYGKIRCAGQGQPRKDDAGNTIANSGHCGEDSCPVCYTFGFTVVKKQGDEEKERSYSGTVNLYDAHILLFPVSSMIGPLWISTKSRLEGFGFTIEGAEAGEDSCALTQTPLRTEPINLGWLMLTVAGQAKVTPKNTSWAATTEWKSIEGRIALVPESLFSQLVNSGLEVRTSVSIDPRTGAAESGALFTYEAIPRTTFLAFDVIQDDYRKQENPLWSPGMVQRAALKVGELWHDNAAAGRPIFPAPDNANQPNGSWTQPYQVVESGLQWAAALGIGGMSTRGFGRIGLVGTGWKVASLTEIAHG